jgi:DNA polymerase-3 subunit epsilon
MSLIFIYDTETTGLVQSSLPPSHPTQPHLVQLGCLLVSDTGKEICSADLIIQPNGYTIPDGAAKVHGITTEIAKECGVPMATALSVFAQLRAKASEVVGFNQKFDETVLRTAFHRYGRQPSHPGPGKITCCMELATPIMKLPPTARMVAAGFDKYKPPNLQEAYKHFVHPDGFDGAHSAVVDCRATAEVYFKIMEQSRTNV